MESTRTRKPFVALLLLLAAGCAGDSGGDGVAPLTVAITDSASDELSSFCVDVDAIQLTKASGATVGALPMPVRLDLVTLEEVSQVLNVLNVPLGLYTAASVTFDFTNAEAYLKGQTTPATLLDGDGNPLTGQVTIPITIGNLLAAVAGRHKVLELDFDLDQSVWVDEPANAVRVEPVIVMRVDRSDPKDLIAGGALVGVDAAANRIDVELQTLGGVPIKPVVVGVDALTVYQLDGVPFLGDAGRDALALMPVGTWVQWYGTVDVVEARFDAAYLEAGTGTYNGGQDIVEGHVIGRVGGAGADATLTVLGHSNDAGHTNFQFNTTFTVSTSFASTRVPVRGTVLTGDTDTVNVGQRVRVFGTLAGMNLDASSATAVLRIQPTRILGFANGTPGSTLDLDLNRVGLRLQAQFTWSEGGPTPPNPASLQASVGSLASGLGIQAGTAVEAIGFFSGIADAGDDFVATSLVNRDLAPSLLAIHDRPAGLAITPTVTTTEISFAITGIAGAAELAVVDQGFVGALPLPTSPAPRVVPAGLFGIYVISDRVLGTASLHLTFADFATTLDAALAGSAQVYNFAAIGVYDPATNTTTSGLAGVVLN